jgi:hypothetical protein
MKSTQTRKVKRSKTRRTRRKARTIHKGGGKWWKFGAENKVAPEPSIEAKLEQTKQFLLKNGYKYTYECLLKEDKIRREGTKEQIYLCSTPCSTNQSTPSAIQQHAPSAIQKPEGYTIDRTTKNGWYKTNENGREGNISSLENANLKNISNKQGRITNYTNSEYEGYEASIAELPDPSLLYHSTIDGVARTFSLKSDATGNRLIWVDNSTLAPIRDILYYNTEKPLTITIQDTEYILTQKSKTES